uniref:Uncharacterized protein n=1 Tax=Octopus bimaculoides TaxID=37653 RepID=A0A0L8GDM8_OCTBM
MVNICIFHRVNLVPMYFKAILFYIRVNLVTMCYMVNLFISTSCILGRAGSINSHFPLCRNVYC